MSKPSRMKILLVEDDDALRHLLELTIEMAEPDADIVGIGHGDEALQLCYAMRPDALVVDGHMPGLSSDELGIALRALVPDATIVSFTGVAGEVAWADTQIVKATEDALDKVVEAVLNKR